LLLGKRSAVTAPTPFGAEPCAPRPTLHADPAPRYNGIINTVEGKSVKSYHKELWFNVPTRRPHQAIDVTGQVPCSCSSILDRSF